MDQYDYLNWSHPLEITVDGQSLELPDWLADSLPSIKTYLECLVMKKERVLWSLQVDGVKVDLADPAFPVSRFSRVWANTISYEELGGYLVAAGHGKIKELRAKLEEAVLLVLINDWTVAEKLWKEWEPQLQEPLFSLRALRELRLPNLLPIFERGSTSSFAEEMSLIACEVDSLFQTVESKDRFPDVVTFSEILEFTLVPWLDRLNDYFDQLEEYHDK